jgi:uncharacterized damage-inducible protein DinB
MSRNLALIQNPSLRALYQSYLIQRQVVRDFCDALPEDQFEYRMVDTHARRSDTPRESLLHLLHVRRLYLRALQSGTLEFQAAPVPSPPSTKQQLLAELETIEQALFELLSSETFECQTTIKTPWGVLPASELLVMLREHDIVHIGWNLALMDHLNMPRYLSLVESWG